MRPSRILALILVILVFPVGTVWAQQTIYGCVKNANGQVRIVGAGEGCLPSEHAIQWAASIPAQPPAVVPPSTVPPQPAPAPPGPLRVVDDNGTALGVFVSSVSGSTAARLVGNLWVALPLTSTTGFLVSNTTDVMPFYPTADCSGDAYLPIDTANLLRPGFVMPGSSGQLAFSYPGTPEVAGSAIQSYAFFNGASWVCGAFSPVPWMPLFGKMSTLDVSTFKGPFKIVQ
jgi:hypothetical protein